MPIHGLAPSTRPVYPPHFHIEAVIRPNILDLHPYRCARDDYQSGILLDANENALGPSIPSSLLDREDGYLDLHRYPDPAQSAIKTRIANLRKLPGSEYIFLGVGSDEVLDLLMRVCCTPGKDKVLITPPTYGMYSVCGQVNDVALVKVPLVVEAGAFQLDLPKMKRALESDPLIKMVFLCSPGNPTGTLIPISDIKEVLELPSFHGIVVVDEAYVDFAGDGTSACALVEKYANLCVMQTLSKSFGLAGIRLGIALAQPPLIQVLSNTKAPYNISAPSARLALSALSEEALALMRQKVATLIASRARLLEDLKELQSLSLAPAIGGNHANFLLVPVLNPTTGKPDSPRAQKIYSRMAEKEGVVIRYRGNEYGCEGCLRITVGSEEENNALIERLRFTMTSI
ncbi:histidinol-phosphate aminotransferase [Dacryopinax primogenitus]|uniref:histidinol-phosphate transaminase n=1 Tax=Dacryopinax primogenitus (strain DJM 731) TaxID=1858805 RepID=M5FUZ5_DACPD|nr:histidinol-phosphate aminotransferase [Dacryopinax primogenitus]EJT99374.1 histidinol-phosphate aminotransferase [Dacryopinax primogenitus]